MIKNCKWWDMQYHMMGQRKGLHWTQSCWHQLSQRSWRHGSIVVKQSEEVTSLFIVLKAYWRWDFHPENSCHVLSAWVYLGSWYSLWAWVGKLRDSRQAWESCIRHLQFLVLASSWYGLLVSRKRPNVLPNEQLSVDNFLVGFSVQVHRWTVGWGKDFVDVLYSSSKAPL